MRHIVVPAGPPTVPAIEVVDISDHEWRISDARIPPGDAACVLGFVQRDGDGFEVTCLAEPHEPVHRREFAECIGYLRDRAMAS